MTKKARKKALSAKQQRAIAVMLAAKNIESGLKTAKIGKTTWYSWLKISAFSEAYAKARREMIDEASRVLERSLTEAAETLRALLKSTDERVQRQAACAIIEQHARRVAAEELEHRLSALEKKITEKTGCGCC